jgi:acyl carrier protein
MSVADQVRMIIADNLGVSIADIEDAADLQEDLGADSLDVVEIIMDIEDKLLVNVTDEELHEVKTVQDLIDLVPF